MSKNLDDKSKTELQNANSIHAIYHPTGSINIDKVNSTVTAPLPVSLSISLIENFVNEVQRDSAVRLKKDVAILQLFDLQKVSPFTAIDSFEKIEKDYSEINIKQLSKIHEKFIIHLKVSVFLQEYPFSLKHKINNQTYYISYYAELRIIDRTGNLISKQFCYYDEERPFEEQLTLSEYSKNRERQTEEILNGISYCSQKFTE